jgi:hypothetical protein
MSKPLIRIHNTETGEILDREMNDAEFAQYQADQAAETIKQAQAEAKKNDQLALFDRLGITAEEAKLLLS